MVRDAFIIAVLACQQPDKCPHAVGVASRPFVPQFLSGPRRQQLHSLHPVPRAIDNPSGLTCRPSLFGTLQVNSTLRLGPADSSNCVRLASSSEEVLLARGNKSVLLFNSTHTVIFGADGVSSIALTSNASGSFVSIVADAIIGSSEAVTDAVAAVASPLAGNVTGNLPPAGSLVPGGLVGPPPPFLSAPSLLLQPPPSPLTTTVPAVPTIADPTGPTTHAPAASTTPIIPPTPTDATPTTTAVPTAPTIPTTPTGAAPTTPTVPTTPTGAAPTAPTIPTTPADATPTTTAVPATPTSTAVPAAPAVTASAVPSASVPPVGSARPQYNELQ